MLNVNSDNQKENELSTIALYILGKIDCPKVTLCIRIAEAMANNSKFLICFNFRIEFETQFELLREKLIQEDIGFLSLDSSPIIYYQVIFQILIMHMYF